MHAINRLVLNRRRPPAVRQDDHVGGDEVQADGAHREGRKHDCAFGVGFEGCHGGVALGCAHGAVNAGVVVPMEGKLGGDDVEERGPLAENNDFSAWFAVRSFKDAEQGFNLGAAGIVTVGLDRQIGAFTQLGRWLDEVYHFQGFGTAHGAAVLAFNDALDAGVAKDVGAGCDDRVVEGFETDRAVFTGFNAELEHVLESLSILWGEVDDFLFFEGSKKGGYALSTEFPVIAYLSQSKENLQQMAICTGSFAFLVNLEESLCFRSTQY